MYAICSAVWASVRIVYTEPVRARIDRFWSVIFVAKSENRFGRQLR